MTAYHALFGTQFWTCDRCGALVIDQTKPQHDEFHDTIDDLDHGEIERTPLDPREP